MGVDVFSINLDKPSRQYSTGENITGNVFLRISGEEMTTEIIIRFFGLARTHWTERRLSSRRDRLVETRRYSDSETFFDFGLRLFGDGSSRCKIPFGDNVFPFSVQVPSTPLPPPCFFDDGYIKYGLEGRMAKPWYQFDPKTDKLPVTIITRTDLNSLPTARNPMQVSDTKTFGCCCCPSQPCFLQSFTPKLGFCPGETIPLSVEINNQSDREIYNVTATLVQAWTLFASRLAIIHTSSTRRHLLPLEAAGHERINPGERIMWNIDFTVPLTVAPMPSPAACKIVKMEYAIMVKAATMDCCGDTNFSVVHPIIIGNEPLTS